MVDLLTCHDVYRPTIAIEVVWVRGDEVSITPPAIVVAAAAFVDLT